MPAGKGGVKKSLRREAKLSGLSSNYQVKISLSKTSETANI